MKNFLTMGAILALSLAAHAGQERGGGHTLTKCDGDVIILDEYQSSSEQINITLSSDPRFSQAAVDFENTLAAIKTKFSDFGEVLEHVYRNMKWKETCHALDYIPDADFPSQGQALPIKQIAKQNELGNVLISRPELAKILKSPTSVRFLVYHEIFKAVLGQQVDRSSLRSIVNATATSMPDWNKFADSMNSIHPHILKGLVEVTVICENCSQIVREQGGTSPLQRLYVDFKYRENKDTVDKRWNVDLKQPQYSFTIPYREADWITVSAYQQFLMAPRFPVSPELHFYSNGRKVQVLPLNSSAVTFVLNALPGSGWH